jgi:cobalt-zinc-cadmium efflux system membrane fusion protein
MNRLSTSVLVLLLAAGCPSPKAANSDEHSETGEHGDEHAHDEGVNWTHMSRASQVLVKWAELKPGTDSEIHVSVTRVGDWKPVEGSVEIVIEVDGKTVKANASPEKPGVFSAKIKPPSAGAGTLSINISGPDLTDTHRARLDVGGHDAPVAIEDGAHGHGHDHPEAKHDHAAEPHGNAEKPHDHAEGGHDHAEKPHDHAEGGHDHAESGHDHAEGIPFSLDQQWSMEFLLRPVVRRTVRPSFEAYGTLRPRMGGEGVVHAATSGRVFAEDMPQLGAQVEKGQTLAWLAPSLSDQGDYATLDFAVSDANVRVRQAEAEVKRLEGLVKDGVIPAKRLNDAQFTLEQARASRTAADQRSRQARGIAKSTGKSAGSIPLVAPISGVIVGIDVPAGLFVESGQALFRIIDPDPIWLEVQVPEAHVARLGKVSGVWFSVEGFDKSFTNNDPQIATGGVLDAHSRTLPLIVTVPNPDHSLRPGMFANANVIDGEPREALTVAVTAVVLENGLPVVYVMKGAESFERRTVRLGQRDGDHVEIIDGVDDGEWVVTRGAYGVRLGSLGNQEVGHGHAH